MFDTTICAKIDYNCSKCAMQSLCGQQYLYQSKDVSPYVVKIKKVPQKK